MTALHSRPIASLRSRCGFREWSGSEAVPGGRLDDARWNKRGADRRVPVGTPPSRRRIAAVDALASAIATLTGLEDERPLVARRGQRPRCVLTRSSNSEGRCGGCDPISGRSSRDNARLLLNLRDVHPFPLTRTATVAEIADVVGSARTHSQCCGNACRRATSRSASSSTYTAPGHQAPPPGPRAPAPDSRAVVVPQ